MFSSSSPLERPRPKAVRYVVLPLGAVLIYACRDLQFYGPRVAPCPFRRSSLSRKGLSIFASAEVSSGTRKDVPVELEEIGLPMNTFSPKKPFTGKIRSVERIVGPKATGETCHIIIETDGQIPFVEGQSYGVIPPGTKINSRGKEVPLGARLYSIASTRYGDSFDGNTTSLCVRRATYYDSDLGREDPAKKGVCSNFLCDAKPGQAVTMTGPTGKILLMPEDQNTPIIMVATGTGIAPYRAFWRRMFMEKIPNYNFTGLAWLFMGVANSDAKLYDDEIQELVRTFPDQFRVDYALSREQKNKEGGKMYIQACTRMLSLFFSLF